MTAATPRSALILLLAAAAHVLAPSATAQLFSENFEQTGATGTASPPADLVARGWAFDITTIGDAAGRWDQGPAGFPTTFPPHEGAGYLAALTQSFEPFSIGRAAMWAVLPDVPLSGGEEITLWIRGDIPQLFEMRFSPSGGTDTGATPEALGDFTTLLASEQYPGDQWHEVVATIPSSGRIALRYYEEGPALSSFVLGLDQLEINAEPTRPPLPGADETVRWTTAMSPIEIDQRWTVMPTGTLIIEPGVEIVFSSADGHLHIEGSLVCEGEPASPIRLTAEAGAASAGISAAYVRTAPGGPLAPATMSLRHVISDASIGVGAGAGVTIRDSVFTAGAGASGIATNMGTLAIYNSSFTGCDIDTRESYIMLADSTFENSRIIYYRRHLSTPMRIDGCTFRNFTGDAPILVGGGNDIFLGDGNTFENTLYPVRLEGGGIFPGSDVPATGSINNYVQVEAGGGDGKETLAAIAVPYHINSIGGEITIEPGAHLRAYPGAVINPYGGKWLGTPDAPIIIEPVDPAQGWARIATAHTLNGKIESLHISGARAGAQNVDGRLYVFDCEISDCEYGALAGDLFGRLEVERTRFRNNDVALHTSYGDFGCACGFGAGRIAAGFAHNPNWIEGNGTGAQMLHPSTSLDARYNWWGDPSGPQHPDNPGGTGDSADPSVDVLPFLTERPNFDDHPPVVRFAPMSRFLWEGQKLILHWTAEDEGPIVAQRLEYAPHQGTPRVVVAADIPPQARSIEVTVPDFVPSGDNSQAVWRIVAVDEAGQEGWSHYTFDHVLPGDQTLEFTPDLSQGFTVGQRFDLSWTPTQGGSMHVLIDDIPQPKQNLDLGGVVLGHMGQNQNDIPAISSDMVRYGLYRTISATERRYWMSEYFEVRPDPQAGDAPPQIALTSPAAGSQHPGGSVVPLRWTASDDTGLRSFDVQASYDGGYSWHFVTQELPGAARAYDWRLPASTGIDDVRVRVIARDQRFQASSDGTDRTFDITPGDWSFCDADCDGSGALDFFDFLCFQARFAGGDPQADCDGSGSLDFFDFLCFQADFAAGCP